MKTELIVENERSVTVNRLNQWRTYSGLIEGLPVERMNNEIIRRTLDEAKELNTHNPVHLIEPVLTPIPYEGKYPFGTPISLPHITCVADLLCFSPAKGSGDYSTLTVVWFQDDYAFPIEPDLLEKFEGLPWSDLAKDFSWEDF